MENRRGFTLIELLIVIAVIGVLTAIIIAAINPAEKLASARDSARKRGIAQLSNALKAYQVNNLAYPDAVVGYMNTLVGSGDLRSVLPVVSNTPGCLGGVYSQNGYCYHNINSFAYVMIPLESKKERQKCTNAAEPEPYYMWDSKQGKIGVVCVSCTTGAPCSMGWSLGTYMFQE